MSGSLSIESLKKPAVLIPLGLFLLSFLLRLIGIGWGMPNELRNQSLHPDETVNYGVSQQIDLAHLQLTPGFYNYGTAYFIAENVADKVAKGYGGDSKDPWQSIAKGIMAGRIISALAGAGCVVVVWLILRRITTLFGALFGVGVVLIAPGFLVHSRFATVDVFAVFWLAMSCLFALRIMGAMPGSIAEEDNRQPRDMRDAILAGVFAGISTGSKYTGILVLVVLWIALGMTRRKGWWQSALAGLGSCLAAFFLTTPGMLLDSERFWRDFQYELGHTASGHGLIFVGTSSGFIYHFWNLTVGLGALLTLAGAATLGFASFRKHAWAIALLAFGILYYVAIGRAEVKFLRYTFPLLIPIAVGFGYGMGAAHRKSGWGRLAVAGGIFAIGGVDFGGLVGAVQYSQFMSAPDPRDQAAVYLKEQAKDGSVGLVKDPWYWSVSLIPDAGMNRGQLDAIFQEVAASKHPQVVRYIPSDGSPKMDWDVRLITEAKPNFIAMTSFETSDEDRLSGLAERDPTFLPQVQPYREFVEKLDSDYSLVRVYGVNGPVIHDMMYIRPMVWIWKRKDLP